jgi:hypothetical protein
MAQSLLVAVVFNKASPNNKGIQIHRSKPWHDEQDLLPVPGAFAGNSQVRPKDIGALYNEKRRLTRWTAALVGPLALLSCIF